MPAEVAGVRVAASVDELVDGASDRRPYKPGDSLSGSHLERLVLHGRPHVLKYISPEDDWLARAGGDAGGRQLALWGSPIPGRLPEVIDHATVGCAPFRTPAGGRGVALLLRDVGGALVPEGSEPLDDSRHLAFIDHMAALHARFWGYDDADGELFPRSHHYMILTPQMSRLEVARGTAGVPAFVSAGWERLRETAPRAAAVVLPLLDDPDPLVEALWATPSTLVHGDCKLGNLGTHDDGRTVLLDWDRCGAGAATADLAWYVAVNCDRIAMPKEDLIAAHRTALERHGVSTGAWWHQQLALALLGGFVMLGWAKADGDPAELAWWQQRVLDAAPLLR